MADNLQLLLLFKPIKKPLIGLKHLWRMAKRLGSGISRWRHEIVTGSGPAKESVRFFFDNSVVMDNIQQSLGIIPVPTVLHLQSRLRQVETENVLLRELLVQEQEKSRAAEADAHFLNENVGGMKNRLRELLSEKLGMERALEEQSQKVEKLESLVSRYVTSDKQHKLVAAKMRRRILEAREAAQGELERSNRLALEFAARDRSGISVDTRSALDEMQKKVEEAERTLMKVKGEAARMKTLLAEERKEREVKDSLLESGRQQLDRVRLALENQESKYHRMIMQFSVVKRNERELVMFASELVFAASATLMDVRKALDAVGTVVVSGWKVAGMEHLVSVAASLGAHGAALCRALEATSSLAVQFESHPLEAVKEFRHVERPFTTEQDCSRECPIARKETDDSWSLLGEKDVCYPASTSNATATGKAGEMENGDYNRVRTDERMELYGAASHSPIPSCRILQNSSLGSNRREEFCT